MRQKITGIILFIFLVSIKASQGLIFKKLGVQDGLSNANVTCFYQDYQGFMWIGTQNGLNRFDGFTFNIYKSIYNDSTSLLNNEVLCIFEDKQQNLWIGTLAGLQKYNRLKDNFEYIPLPDRNFSVKAMLQDNRGRIWIGSRGGGIYYYNEKTKKIEKAKYKPIHETSINALAEDTHGNVWVATEFHGVFVMDTKTDVFKKFNEFVRNTNKPVLQKVKSIVFSRNGVVWIGTYGDGLYKYDALNATLTKADFNIKADLILNMYVDNNSLMIADDEHGLYIVDLLSQRITHYKKDESDKYSISTNALWTIYKDRNNIFWFGSYSGGINYAHIPDNTSLYLINSDAYPGFNNNVSAVLSDKNNDLWIGTDGGGLKLMKKGSQKMNSLSFASQGVAQNKSILSLFQDNDGDIFIGYYLDGYGKVNSEGKNYIHVYKKEYGSNDIRCITQDNDGNLWIGTNGDGVFCMDKKGMIVAQYTQDNADTSKNIVYNFIRSIIQDSKGYIWIGTCYGTSRIDVKSNRIINFPPQRNTYNQIVGNFVGCILESTNGYLYFGTNMGLSKLMTPVWSDKYTSPSLNATSDIFIFKSFTTSSGLPDDIVNSIIEDGNYNLWLGTNNGLCMFNPEKEIFKRIDLSESNETFVFNLNSCSKSNNGTLYFGTNRGVVSLHPDSLVSKKSDVIVRITDIKINFESLKKYNTNAGDSELINPSLLKNISLYNKDKAVTFEFSSLEYNWPKKILYKYTLTGFDDKWIETDANHRYATYTNLNPGEYTFKVMATNTEGIWSEKITEITVRVFPPFWKEWWFRLVIVVLIVLAIFLFIRYRTKSIEKRKQVLEIMVKQRTSELIEEREKQRLKDIENNSLLIKQKELEATNLLVEKELMRLRNEKLEREIEIQNAEVTRKNTELAALGIQLSQRIEFISKLKNKLKTLLEDAELNNNPILQKIIVEIEKDNSLDKEWEQFEFYFNQVNNNFLTRLKEKYPQLTSHDLRLCGYLRMNLSTKEIAMLLNISVRGVEKSRSRLKKKLGLSNDEQILDSILTF